MIDSVSVKDLLEAVEFVEFEDVFDEEMDEGDDDT